VDQTIKFHSLPSTTLRSENKKERDFIAGVLHHPRVRYCGFMPQDGIATRPPGEFTMLGGYKPYAGPGDGMQGLLPFPNHWANTGTPNGQP
jgi:hypothetical protein